MKQILLIAFAMLTLMGLFATCDAQQKKDTTENILSGYINDSTETFIGSGALRVWRNDSIVTLSPGFMYYRPQPLQLDYFVYANHRGYLRVKTGIVDAKAAVEWCKKRKYTIIDFKYKTEW